MESSNSSSTTPAAIPYHLLEEITKGFSEMLGCGGYGEVFKGIHNGEDIAVKKLYYQPGLDNEPFRNEFQNLMRVRHQNIVRLVGYCYEIKYTHLDHNGETVFGKWVHRALCFEYLHGSLDKHLYEESGGHDWPTRYKIIKGTCEGLNYLHGGMGKPMFHLDLKPANILLDRNMTPKIADFGLSRLFGGTSTHITDACKGTIAYMPPEYISKKQISNKYDVFSLGVIIVQIMAGPQGYADYGNISSPQEFIDLVHKKWSERIVDTSKYVEESRDQVKRCIEIALKCVEPEKKNRPTIAGIIDDLEQTETTNGPWGGDAGWSHDTEVLPQRLLSVTIWCGDVIDALTFTYSDVNGKKHISGPWGGPGGVVHTIQLGPSEYLTEVSGTTGSFGQDADVVKSLVLVTNSSRYGPFGKGEGNRFQASMRGSRSISGFFARAGMYVYAIGVYTKHNRSIAETATTNDGNEEVNLDLQVEREHDHEDDAVLKLTPSSFYPLSDFFVRDLVPEVVARIGPWGGNGGTPKDVEMTPHRLESLTVCSGDVINSLTFTYSDLSGRKHTVGPWGGDGGTAYTIQLGPTAFLDGIFGTFGPYGTSSKVITSLQFVTNQAKHETLGQGGGTKFNAGNRFMLGETGSIVGFFGSGGSYVETLGVYIRKYSY
ncbi:hypothetical protein QYE76_019664 [Lolium multiflorum]|uniref:Jacalin-like lectin domain-containing protein n=1 Tax=Lolium multiflorum TaxID=4521 RepID=A0AAD8VND2_LOLMU|nr:hypothetical protein QYE76_019664 [Lolium multiflorum]